MLIYKKCMVQESSAEIGVVDTSRLVKGSLFLKRRAAGIAVAICMRVAFFGHAPECPPVIGILPQTLAGCAMQGLALPALAKDAWEMPAFFRMVQQGVLRDPVFSVWLDPNPNAVPAGEVLFGGADPSHFLGSLTFIKVISQKCEPAPCKMCQLMLQMPLPFPICAAYVQGYYSPDHSPHTSIERDSARFVRLVA